MFWRQKKYGNGTFIVHVHCTTDLTIDEKAAHHSKQARYHGTVHMVHVIYKKIYIQNNKTINDFPNDQ